MESKAPVSRVVRARVRMVGDVEGVGRRQLSFRRRDFVRERRVVISCESEREVDCSWSRTFCRSEVGDIVDGWVVEEDRRDSSTVILRIWCLAGAKLQLSQFVGGCWAQRRASR